MVNHGPKRQGLYKLARDMVLVYRYFKQEVDARLPLFDNARVQAALLKHMVIQELELWNELLSEAKSSLKINGNVEFHSQGKTHEVKKKKG